jgi:hypothetical protein
MELRLALARSSTHIRARHTAPRVSSAARSYPRDETRRMTIIEAKAVRTASAVPATDGRHAAITGGWHVLLPLRATRQQTHEPPSRFDVGGPSASQTSAGTSDARSTSCATSATVEIADFSG